MYSVLNWSNSTWFRLWQMWRPVFCIHPQPLLPRNPKAEKTDWTWSVPVSSLGRPSVELEQRVKRHL